MSEENKNLTNNTEPNGSAGETGQPVNSENGAYRTSQYQNWQGNAQGGQYQNWKGNAQGGQYQNRQGNAQGGQYQNWQGNPQGGQYQNWQGNPQGGQYQNWQGNPQGGQYQNWQGNPQGGQYQNWQGNPGAQYQGGYGNPRGGYQQQYQGNYGQQPMGNGKKPKKKKKRKTLFIIEIIVLLILALGLFVFVQLGRMDRTSLKDILTNAGVENQSGYQNIVIYGVDSREGELTKDSHSDTIIICSINKKTKEIKMVSVYRDTYLDNTNGEYRKATECYYFGGPERSINMLNKNLDLDIKDYVTVNFNVVVEAVDLIGGIELEITEEELQWLNGYQVENSEVTGASYEPLPAAGYQHLNGNQTLAYCRIRYTDGYDFKRTERQRLVLQKIFDKAKSMGVPTLLSLANTLLPSVSTSLSNTELIGLVSGVASYSLGENTGFPFNSANSDINGSCVVPLTLTSNVSQLHEFLFGEVGYVPSDTVQSISSEISYATGIYG